MTEQQIRDIVQSYLNDNTEKASELGSVTNIGSAVLIGYENGQAVVIPTSSFGTSNLALGETQTTAYRGDRGKTAYEHSQSAHAPSNAQKNSDITKAEIEAKLTGNITTHTHDSYLPKSGGQLDSYVEKLVTTTGAINLNNGNVFYCNATANTTFSISNAKAGAHSFTLIIDMGNIARTLTFPNSVKWDKGEVPDMSEINKTYVLTFLTINQGTTWLGMEGGSF